jgi:translation initiation factor IF-2
MSHKKEGHYKKEKKKKEYLPQNNGAQKQTTSNAPQPKLEIVLKCDTTGSLEAVKAAVLDTLPGQVTIEIIHSGIGTINKSDVFMAETGSHLIIGFNVDVDSQAESFMKTGNIEIRLFQIIYRLTEDVKTILEKILSGKHDWDSRSE